MFTCALDISYDDYKFYFLQQEVETSSFISDPIPMLNFEFLYGGYRPLIG